MPDSTSDVILRSYYSQRETVGMAIFPQKTLPASVAKPLTVTLGQSAERGTTNRPVNIRWFARLGLSPPVLRSWPLTALYVTAGCAACTVFILENLIGSCIGQSDAALLQ